jgi:hypothetical protein
MGEIETLLEWTAGIQLVTLLDPVASPRAEKRDETIKVKQPSGEQGKRSRMNGGRLCWNCIVRKCPIARYKSESLAGHCGPSTSGASRADLDTLTFLCRQQSSDDMIEPAKQGLCGRL